MSNQIKLWNVGALRCVEMVRIGHVILIDSPFYLEIIKTYDEDDDDDQKKTRIRKTFINKEADFMSAATIETYLKMSTDATTSPLFAHIVWLKPPEPIHLRVKTIISENFYFNLIDTIIQY